MADADDSIEPKTEVNPCMDHCGERCSENGSHEEQFSSRMRQTGYLLEEMLFEISLRLPAQALHDVMRFVCRKWNILIRSQDFTRHHLRNSTSGILVQCIGSPRRGFYVEMRGGSLKIHKLNCGFKKLLWSSCNGLVLARLDRQTLYVANPLTKQQAVLPLDFRKMGSHWDFCLAFVEASKEYKVAHACSGERLGQIALLTVGVDKVWRHIDIKHLLLQTDHINLPMVTGGYVHWMCETFVLTMNVETETVCRFPQPPMTITRGRFLPMGSNLSFVSVSEEFSSEVWEMNPETGEWTMLLSFDLEPLRDRFKGMFCRYAKTLLPFGWLADKEVLFLSTHQFQRYGIAYNLKTREIQSFEFHPNTGSLHFQAHVSSLVWLGGEEFQGLQ